MSRLVIIANAGELADALEDWIIDNKCNPKTPAEWDRFCEFLLTKGLAEEIGSIEDEELSEFKKELREAGVQEFKITKESEGK